MTNEPEARFFEMTSIIGEEHSTQSIVKSMSSISKLMSGKPLHRTRQQNKSSSL